MSSIDELSIQGIRSFGVDPADEQKIKFTSPLTVIVGENGSGKTTVIECLKYALTDGRGSQNSSLVHDPAVSDVPVSDGKIELKMTDEMNRSIECTRKLSNDRVTSWKTGVNSFIRFDPASQERKILKGKKKSEMNIEMNADMKLAMGVSDSMLENVIFCSEEDSNWPLQKESSKLNETFNGIFGIADSNEACKRIEKIITQTKNELDKSKGKKEKLQIIKVDAENRELNLNELKRQHEKVLSNVAENNEELEAVKTLLEPFETLEKTVNDLQNEKAETNGKLQTHSEHEEELRKTVGKRLEDSLENLQHQLREFDSTHQGDELKLQALTEKLDLAGEKKKEAQKIDAELAGENKVLSSKINDRSVRLLVRFNKMTWLKDQLKLECTSSSYSDEEFGKILKAVEEKKVFLENVELDKTEADLNLRDIVSKSEVEKATIGTESACYRGELDDLTLKEGKLVSEIENLKKSIDVKANIDREIESAEAELQKHNDEKNSDQIKKRRDEARLIVEGLNRKVESLEKEILQLEPVTNASEDLKALRSQFDRIKDRSSSSLKALIKKEISKDFSSNIRSINTALDEKVFDIKTELKDAHFEADQLNSNIGEAEAQKKGNEVSLRETKILLTDLCGKESFPDVLRKQNEAIERLRYDLAFQKAAADTFKKFIDDLQGKPSCPLCDTNLGVEKSGELSEELKRKTLTVPAKIAEIDEKLVVESESLNELMSAKPNFDGITQLEKEIKELVESLKSMSELKTEKTKNIEKLKVDLQEPQQKLEMLTPELSSDVHRLDELFKNLEVGEANLKKLKTDISSATVGKDLTAMKGELQGLISKQKTENTSLESLDKELDESRNSAVISMKRLNELRIKKNDLDEEYSASSLTEKQNDLEATRKTVREKEEKINGNDSALAKIEEDLQVNEEELRNQITKLNIKIPKERDELKSFQKCRDDIDAQNIEIENLDKENLQVKVDENKKRIDDNTAHMQRLDLELSTQNSEAEQLRSEMTKREVLRRQLQDNVDLMLLENAKAEAQVRLGEINQKMEALKPSLDNKTQLEIKQEEFVAQSNKLSGQSSTFINRIQIAKAELSEIKFKDAKQNYMTESYNVAVLTAMINDLKEFNAILEKSLLECYDKKIEEVNATIRHLWRKIYKGNDIDYIKIKINDGIFPNKRRTYNYRVMQVKHSKRELDMREYGSSGQKVLASLVIRMALADTFNCRILALDEPTTNLDRKNVKALSDALNVLVEEREKIGPFMLIVISHDEKFVAGLERSDHIFRISRVREGKSVITKVLR